MDETFDLQITVWDDGKRVTLLNHSYGRSQLADLLQRLQEMNASDLLPQTGSVSL